MRHLRTGARVVAGVCVFAAIMLEAANLSGCSSAARHPASDSSGAASAAGGDDGLPANWTPVTMPAQDTLEWRIITREVPAHYEAGDFNAKTGDYNRHDEARTIKLWQANDPAATPRDSAADEKESRAAELFHGEGCPDGMVRVKGRMKDFAIVTAIQDQSCRVGPDKKPWNPTELCYRYDLSGFEQKYDQRKAKLEAQGKPVHEKDLDFCIDRYEYPNARGQYPAIMVDWFDARAICEGEGKRLCTEDEWTFACEGEEGHPYPTGDVKDPTACQFDRIRKAHLDEAVVEQFDTPAAKEMIAGLWGAVPSGQMEKCASVFGVHDLTGNVDEWTTWTAPGRPRDMTVNHGKGWLSMLKGGFWGPVRNRCQPSTSSHEPGFRFYQQGFRCCRPSGS